MLRIFIILLNLIVALFIDVIIGDDVQVTTNTSAEVVAGNELMVTVTVDKDDLQSFARFQQTLPEGLIAYPDYTANAVDFTFENNTVKIIWLRLPEDEQFSFSYRVKIDERLKGQLDLNGIFSYIDNNERQTVAMEEAIVAIQSNPNIDPSLVVDIRDFGKVTIPNYITPVVKGDNAVQVAAIRQQPWYNADNNEYIVHLLINKNNLKQFAKIEEDIPQNFTAVNIDSKDGIFTFRDQIAKIIWRNLPSDETFIVSYKLIPNEDLSAAAVNITGTFSYFESDITHTFNITETTVNIAELAPSEQKQFIRSFLAGNQEEYLADNSDEQKPVEEENNVNTKNNLTPDNTATTNVTKQLTDREVPKSTYTNRRFSLKYKLEPQTGVYYRVQIAAGHRKVNIPRYFNRFDLEYDVKMEQHEGWNKYSVGSFSVYKSARDYRVHLWNTTEIDDAFVSAYNEGKRITVQEALMIVDQNWYR